MSRLDEWFVKNLILPSRSKATRFIREIGVTINGRLIKKPSYKIKPQDHVQFDETILQKFQKPVGHQKLARITSSPYFPCFASNDRCLDVGANVGGFSLYLLEQNVASVLAIEISKWCEPYLKKIQDKWSNFSYRIANFFELKQKDFPHPFNVITADLTLDPQFLIQKIDLFIQLLQLNHDVPARFLTTVKTGKIKNLKAIFFEIEQKISQSFPDASYSWLESLPNKQEQILLIVLQ